MWYSDMSLYNIVAKMIMIMILREVSKCSNGQELQRSINQDMLRPHACSKFPLFLHPLAAPNTNQATQLLKNDLDSFLASSLVNASIFTATRTHSIPLLPLFALCTLKRH